MYLIPDFAMSWCPSCGEVRGVRDYFHQPRSTRLFVTCSVCREAGMDERRYSEHQRRCRYCYAVQDVDEFKPFPGGKRHGTCKSCRISGTARMRAATDAALIAH